MIDNADNRKMVTEAFYRYKILFDSAARTCGGQITWLSQHSMLWGALRPRAGYGQPKENAGFVPDYWLGICAGLAMEWLKDEAKVDAKTLAKPKNFISNLQGARQEVFTKGAAERTTYLETLSTRVSDAHQRQNNLAHGDALGGSFSKAGDKEFIYPYADMGSAFKPKGFISKSKRYFYVSSGTHAMGATINTDGKVDFYDPNVGLVTGTTPAFFPIYLRGCAEASAAVQNTTVPPGKKMNVAIYDPK